MTPLVLCRFAHFVSLMLAFGASAYLRLCAPNGLRAALGPNASRVVAAAGVAAFLSAILWLLAETAAMADDWRAAFDRETIAEVLTDTEFGRVWIARLVLAGALAILVVAVPGRWAATAFLSGVVLASLALVGHAAMRSGAWGAFQRTNDAIHLMSAGAWIGGLFGFIGSLGAYRDERLRRDAVGAMTRFSFTGQFVVAAIIVSGAVNIALVSGRAPIPPTTPYRALLCAKITLVTLMIALAATNRFVLAPKLATHPNALARLRATATAEVALGTAVVALVSVFALLNPA